jgi:two-component system cell cycle response regulator
LRQTYVLIVQGDESNGKILFKQLKKLAYKVELFSDGKLALDHAKREIPDIILLDLRLPGMDGFSVCQSLKNEPITSKIKIIIFSGYSDTEKIEKAFKAGADLYIAKPVDILTIKQIIENAANSSEFPSKDMQEIDRVFAPY